MLLPLAQTERGLGHFWCPDVVSSGGSSTTRGDDPGLDPGLGFAVCTPDLLAVRSKSAPSLGWPSLSLFLRPEVGSKSPPTLYFHDGAPPPPPQTFAHNLPRLGRSLDFLPGSGSLRLLALVVRLWSSAVSVSRGRRASRHAGFEQTREFAFLPFVGSQGFSGRLGI